MHNRFKSLINSETPVLIDFYADWCQPCKQMAPVLQTVKKDMVNLRIFKVNVDRNPVIAHSYGISSVPTLILFKKGEPQWYGVGLQTAVDIKKEVKRHL